ncbi:MAG TPA: TfoX/Sxy family protein [Candidatus Kapabacteria bacterium]|nr:TfoX/Sxy family protein [Candidatus Kapabacteria bacterium]
MAYSEALAARIRERFAELPNVEEKRMMGGLVFMYNDKMCVGIMQDELMCRVDPARHNELVEKPGCRTMEFANRPAQKVMSGYILIDDSAMKTKKDLNYWIQLALDHNAAAKSSKKKKKA